MYQLLESIFRWRDDKARGGQQALSTAVPARDVSLQWGRDTTEKDLVLARHNGLGMGTPKLSLITGAFIDKDQERAFSEAIWPECRRVGIIVVSIVLVCATLLSIPLVPIQDGSPKLLASLALAIAGLAGLATTLILLIRNRRGIVLDLALFSPGVTLAGYLIFNYVTGLITWDLALGILLSNMFIYGAFMPHRPPFALGTLVMFLGVYVGCGIYGGMIAEPMSAIMFFMIWVSSVIVVRSGASGRRQSVFQKQQYEELAERLDGNLHDSELKNRAMERAAEENAALADELALARMAAEENAAVLEVVLDTMPQGVMAYGPDQRVIKGNNQYARLMGIPNDLTRAGTAVKAIFERSLKSGVIPGETQLESALEIIRKYAEDRSSQPISYERRNSAGGHYEIRLMPLPGGGAVSTIADITERKRADEIIREQARRDPLTNLSNRFDYADQLDEALARSRRTGKYVALAYLDLDLFKPVNDTYGHSVGDAVLCELASLLRAHVREVDTVARLGGDEFAIIFDGITSISEVSNPIDRILRATARPISAGDVKVQIGVSVGVAFFPVDAHTAEGLAEAADRQLYEAKNSGRGCCKMSQMEEEPGTRRILGDVRGIVIN